MKYINNGTFTSPYVDVLSGEEKYEQVAYFINNAHRIVFLTGAGISTNSGIPDFRSKQGWYSKNPEDILSSNNLKINPIEVYEFLYKYWILTKEAKPSKSHKIIKELEKYKDVSVITQNIDRLHSCNKNVIEFHGDLKNAVCINCKTQYSIETLFNDGLNFNTCPNCGKILKPNIVLYDENVKGYNRSKKMCKNADLIFLIGSSLQVEPFATLCLNANCNTPFIIINKSATYLDNNNMSVKFDDDCDLVLDAIFKKYINKYVKK